MEFQHKSLTRHRVICLVCAALILAGATLIDVLIGPAFLNVVDVLHALVRPQEVETTLYAIVYVIRLPMTLMAVLVGFSLGISGAHMQTILGNSLASPYTLGFSAAAGFGAAMAILSGISIPGFETITTPLIAFVMASLAALLVYGFSSIRGMRPEAMILAGIATLFLFQSLQSMVQYMASPEVLQEIVFWLFGSMVKANWTNIPITAVILLFGVIVLLPDMWKLTALKLGDERAQSLGVNVRNLRIKVFIVAALLTAGAVSFVGTIGFIGLVAPHISRMLVGEDQRFFVPLSGITGATLMAGSSILSKLISPGTIVPIGIVTAVMGVPFLFALIAFKKREF